MFALTLGKSPVIGTKAEVNLYTFYIHGQFKHHPSQ